MDHKGPESAKKWHIIFLAYLFVTFFLLSAKAMGRVYLKALHMVKNAFVQSKGEAWQNQPWNGHLFPNIYWLCFLYFLIEVRYSVSPKSPLYWLFVVESSQLKCCGLVVITATKLHCKKMVTSFCTGSDPALNLLEVCNVENLWPWSETEIRLHVFHLPLCKNNSSSSPPNKKHEIVCFLVNPNVVKTSQRLNRDTRML